MSRTDRHRPSVMKPEEYREVLSFCQAVPEKLQPAVNRDEAVELYRQKGVGIHGGIFQCDLCGAHYRYGSLFEHEPTGELISVGHDCADKLDLMVDWNAAERMRELGLAGRERAEREQRLSAWKADNAEVWAVMEGSQHPIVVDIRARLISTGARWGLSDKQVELVKRIVAQEKMRAEEKHVPVPFRDGERARVEGSVVSVKSVESPYGRTWKMTLKVQTPGGCYLLHGSVPSQLIDKLEARELVGQRVGLTALVQHGRDVHFAFYKRPTKAEVL